MVAPPRPVRMEHDMSTKTPYLAIGSIVLVAIVVACDSRKENAFRSPTAPPPVNSAPVLVDVDLIAPSSIAPGESVQVIANAIKSDKSVENVTEKTQWTSSDPGVVEVSATGVAKGVARGEAVIMARYQSRGAGIRTFVLPTGTYRLSGAVRDSGFGLAGVAIAIIDGEGKGLTTTTNENGNYALYGASGRVRLHATRAGYLNEVQETDVTRHHTFNIEMRLERQRTDLRGNYRLTIDRMGCPDAPLPETRSYDAFLAQDGPQLSVALSGANFIVTLGFGNSFSGVIDGSNRVTFNLIDAAYYSSYYYGHHSLVERISGTSTLVISGRVIAGLSSTGISGTLNGKFSLTNAIVAPFVHFGSVCAGTAHRFEMVRQ